jgi:outer membrane biosynthesis protein TonB
MKEQKEIEVIMVVNGTTWAGLGWRSRKLTASCKNFPVIREYGQPEEPATPAAEPAAEPAVEPTAEPAAEPSAEPEPHPETEPSSEPEPSKEPAAEPKPASEPSPSSEPASQKSKRKVKSLVHDESTSKQGITVATSVSYQVSAKTGRRKKRAFTLGSKYITSKVRFL